MKKDEEIYKLAKKRVKMKQTRNLHIIIYIAVMILLTVINIMFSQTNWVIYPMLGWGALLVIHCIITNSLLDGSNDKAINKEVEKIKKSIS